MNTTKFNGFFDPTKVEYPIHIIGCGAIGSTLALNLARCGLTEIHLWDYDIVNPHNIANQQYNFYDVGDKKTFALAEAVTDINPQAKVYEHGKWDDDQLTGYVFLAVDSITTRQAIVKRHLYTSVVKAMFDFRMRLKDAQHFAADWSTIKNRKVLLSTMNFTEEEAQANNVVNACNMTMSIIPTVDTVVAVGLTNFINFIHTKEINRLVMVNPFEFDIT